MTPFLQSVADDLIAKYGRDLSRLVVVFPNKRARLFFGEYLASHGTVWAPAYTTISELFRSLSDVRLNDNIDTVCRMHRTYCGLTGSDETLDAFYGWGERLLADFNDADKNLADTDRLFTNVKDYKTIDFGDFMTEDEKKVIKSFFQQFDEGDNTRVKDNFLKLWNHMLPIYRALNEELLQEGVAYEGALQRRCLENLKAGKATLPPLEQTEKWIFVGLNVLDKVEHGLLTYLRDCGRAAFYWDYDRAYVYDDTRYEAGEFMRQNLEDFKNELTNPEIFQNISGEQDFEFVAAPTENAQAFQATEWLRQHYVEGKRNTAIVICNEQMLEPVLHVLPDNIDEVNVTKGFPLSHTSVFSQFMRELGEYERKNPDSSCLDYIAALQSFIEGYAREPIVAEDEGEAATEDEMMQALHNEACFRIYTMLERLRNIAFKPYFTADHTTLSRLIRQLARQTDVPFHGEPAVGLQIMGMLETRNLDFENILMLSVNEGVIPKPAADNSFIPYPLKAAFGLTLASKKTAVYAYYFFRLIQRAKHVRFVYNCTANHIQTGEMSRYMTQLLLSGKFNIKHYQLSSRLTVEIPRVLSAEKPDNLPQLLTTRTLSDGTTLPLPLSPSALNLYLDCPLQFYFSRIAHIHKPQDDPDQMDNRHFGTLFHDSAELLYRDAKNAGVRDYRAWIGQILGEKDDKTLKDYIEKAYSRLKAPRDVVAEVTVLRYLKKLLHADAALDNLEIVDVEKDMYMTIPVSIGDKTVELKVGGRIDRLDIATNPDADSPASATTLRIVDYKTGRSVQKASDMTEVFEKKKERPYYFFQTFLYALIAKKHITDLCKTALPVSTVLFYPSQYGREDYSPWVMFDGHPLYVFTDELASEFRKMLTATLEEILNPEIPFKATDNPNACIHCDYRLLCGKKEKE